MNLIGAARRLEAKFSDTVDRAAKRLAPAGPRHPLELMHAIVDAVDRRIEPSGRGRHVFPFNRLRVTVLAPSREMRSRLEAVLSDEPSLEQRIAEHLRGAGCDPSNLSLRVAYQEQAEPHWSAPDFHLELDRVPVAPAAPAASAAPARIDLTVAAGSAEQTSYTFAGGVINLGRGRDVRDQRHRLVRANDVAFAEGAGEVNHTVSRRHAHIECAGEAYRLCDDGSAHGTSIVRRGRTIDVPTGTRGIRLLNGDEIVLGEARLHVSFGQR